MTTDQAARAERFRSLHAGPGAFVIANPWDAGSARMLAGLGFEALATSSGAAAGVLGRRDGQITRDEALAHARAIVDGDRPAGVGRSGERLRRRAGGRRRDDPAAPPRSGLVGGSIEDATGDKDRPLYDLGHATERVAAAVAGGACAAVPVHADRARRELPARQPGSRRHDPAPAGVRAGGRRRAVRARPAGSRGGARGLRRAVQAGQLHGRHQGASRSASPSSKRPACAASASPPRCTARR